MGQSAIFYCIGTDWIKHKYVADDESCSVVHGRLLLLRDFKCFCSECHQCHPWFAQEAVGSGAVVVHGPSAWEAICLCGVAVTPGQKHPRAFLWHLDQQLRMLHSYFPESKAVRYSPRGSKVLFRTSLGKLGFLIVSCPVLNRDF